MSQPQLQPRRSEAAAARDIVRATTTTELDDARHLMRNFVAWHRRRHAADIALVDRYFDEATFARELAELPGAFAAPHGALFIAYHRGRPAGCIALRNLGLGIAEMKRLYVDDPYRGLGLGRALAERVLAEAKAIGYHAIRLDTSRHQIEAIRLYESLGFSRIQPYHPLEAALDAWLYFFEREL
ncbi:GNAT family N-acetyltransferase [Dongia rigui]|uniref:GNAT family N-acetyltransferase n=1 Tax=Dongia rigui TaxID=940149 RepID=A0ABU5DXL2_9PROT|nr:GNAT family N-acetyltransferase [Dongia rigui]MDY0872035.1 GNAT family N-acetyltransferase [Dongia rigui]